MREDDVADQNAEDECPQAFIHSRSENPLHLWRSNAHRFPIMSEATCTYLAAPPTSVPSERVFSISGDTLSDHRSRLLPENAERLILLKFNLKLLNVV